MLTVLFLLAIAAFVLTLLSTLRAWCPLWVAVLLLSIIALLQHIPLGR